MEEIELKSKKKWINKWRTSIEFFSVSSVDETSSVWDSAAAAVSRTGAGGIFRGESRIRIGFWSIVWELWRDYNLENDVPQWRFCQRTTGFNLPISLSTKKVPYVSVVQQSTKLGLVRIWVLYFEFFSSSFLLIKYKINIILKKINI